MVLTEIDQFCGISVEVGVIIISLQVADSPTIIVRRNLQAVMSEYMAATVELMVPIVLINTDNRDWLAKIKRFKRG